MLGPCSFRRVWSRRSTRAGARRMQRVASLGILIILPRLATIEAAVLADDANLAVPERRDSIELFGRPALGRLGILPGDEKTHFSRVVDARPDIVLDDAAVAQIEPEMARQEVRLRREGGPLDGHDLGEGRELARAGLGFVETALMHGGFLRRIGVGRHIADPQVIVLKDLETSLLL